MWRWLPAIIWIFILAILALFIPACLQESDLRVPTTPVLDRTPAPIEPNWRPKLSQVDQPILPSIADVVAKAKPSVVAINTEAVTYDVFNRLSIQQGAGSGWIIDQDGIIVTNSHVVEGAERITVTLSDDQVFSVETVRTDPLTDLAVIKISGSKLPSAKLGDAAKLRVGDWVVAIGNPLGFGISAKEGIVSRFGVSISVSAGQTLYGLIETSAAINPGNSGGPLLNMASEVIGITSIKVATVGVEGLGYAININTALPVIEELIRVGCVVRPWLGIEAFTINDGLALRFKLPVNKGAIVTEVAPDSPADKAGIEQGDIIVGSGDREIVSAQDLMQAEQSSKIGEEITITLWRGNQRQNIDVKLTETPPCVY